MVRPPPRSTLFPTRRSSDLGVILTPAGASLAEDCPELLLSLEQLFEEATRARRGMEADRKSTRLNSSHSQTSYAVFCLKKKRRAHHSDHARPRLSGLHIRHC